MAKFKLRPLQGGYSNQYDPTIEPGIANVFATASYRSTKSVFSHLVNLLKFLFHL